jgi:NADH dehydrogenase
MENKKTIVILGGGFGGVNAAILLSRKLGQACRITLVDQNDYHLYYPNLYEVATSEEEFTSIADLKHSVTLPFKKILPPEINFMKGSVKKIDQQTKLVQLESGQGLAFDYLIVALGAMTDYFNVPGLAEFALTLKSLPDALKIRNAVEFVVESHRLDVNKKLVRIIVGGGGFSGVELSGELVKLIRILSWKYSYPLEKIEILIVEGTSQLLPGMPGHISRRIFQRLKDLGVQIRFGNFISKAEQSQILLNNGEVINYDVLIWTGGTKSVKIPFVQAVPADAKDRLQVNAQLQLSGSENIFVIGDNAQVLGKDGKAVAMTATQAIAQGEYIAEILSAKIKGQNFSKPYRSAAQSYIIPVSGKWAVLHWGPLNLDLFGFIGWLAHRYADLEYFNRLMPFGKALRLACFAAKLYAKHD